MELLTEYKDKCSHHHHPYHHHHLQLPPPTTVINRSHTPTTTATTNSYHDTTNHCHVTPLPSTTFGIDDNTQQWPRDNDWDRQTTMTQHGSDNRWPQQQTTTMTNGHMTMMETGRWWWHYMAAMTDDHNDNRRPQQRWMMRRIWDGWQRTTTHGCCPALLPSSFTLK